MNREIKFRAWDKNINKMHYLPNMSICYEYSHISFEANAGDLDGICEWPEGDDSEIENQVIMQYTGLKDKNGVEIYEGDIVKSIYNARHVNINSAITEEIMLVEHDDCNPCFVLVGVTNKDKREYDFIQCGLRRNEVIGNIYETPELLKDKK